MHRQRSGTTLVETLFTVLIIAVVLTIASAMFIVLLRTYSLYTIRADLVLSASKIAEEVARNANLAFGVEASRTINSTVYVSGGETVIFTIASIDAGGNMIPGTFDSVVLTADPLDSTRLLEVTDANAASSRQNTTRLLGENVKDYHFSYRDASPTTSNEIFFGVTMAKIFRSSIITHKLNTHAKFRNK
ncbi:MAG: hypothetical protein HY566_02190 [Candidatus Kerfeldbacteria bacterium]|nr:hypothetical protein [Candidatus Kerfeldbacteria bacterium]